MLNQTIYAHEVTDEASVPYLAGTDTKVIELVLDRIAFFGVIYAHQLRVSIGAAIDQLHLIAAAGDPDDLLNKVQFLPL